MKTKAKKKNKKQKTIKKYNEKQMQTKRIKLHRFLLSTTTNNTLLHTTQPYLHYQPSSMFTTLELPGMRRAVAGGQKDARDPLIPPDLPKKILSRYTAKSRLGCLTCKARKKKCDETRPVCRDCLRFNKECVWVDQSMSGSEIRRLRKEVQEKAKESKLRRRRSKKAKLEEVEGASVFLLEGMEKGHEKNRGKNHESKNRENMSLKNKILENKSPENNILENNILVNVILRQSMFTVPDITPLGQEYTLWAFPTWGEETVLPWLAQNSCLCQKPVRRRSSWPIKMCRRLLSMWTAFVFFRRPSRRRRFSRF